VLVRVAGGDPPEVLRDGVEALAEFDQRLVVVQPRVQVGGLGGRQPVEVVDPRVEVAVGGVLGPG
jgi:hypothetical protein